jgi:hypothetical protein
LPTYGFDIVDIPKNNIDYCKWILANFNFLEFDATTSPRLKRFEDLSTKKKKRSLLSIFVAHQGKNVFTDKLKLKYKKHSLLSR